MDNHADVASTLVSFSEFVVSELANRHDVFGKYTTDKHAITAKEPLTRDIVFAHVEGKIVVGLHAIGPDNLSRSVAWDFDNHESDPETARANIAGARQLWETLRGLGAEPVLEDSDGQGGYHLWVIFGDPVPSADAHAWAKALAPQGVEYFPKQPVIEKGGYGNWLRLPGRHPRRDHWSSIWDGSQWVPWPDCLELLTAAPRCPADLVPEAPSDEPALDDADPAVADDSLRPMRDRLLAIRCLLRLGPRRADDYDEWLRVGMALHAVDSSPIMLSAWEFWSQQSKEKYESGVCAEQWQTLGNRKKRRVGLASLVRWALEDARLAEGPREDRLAELNGLLLPDAAETKVNRIIRSGGPGGALDLELSTGETFPIGTLAIVVGFDSFRRRFVEITRTVIPSALRKEWDQVARLICSLVEEQDGPSPRSTLEDLLESLIAADDPIDADDEEERNALLATRAKAFFVRRGALYVRLDALDHVNSRRRVLRLDRAGIGHLLELMGWTFERHSFGPRSGRTRMEVFRAPEGWRP